MTAIRSVLLALALGLGAVVAALGQSGQGAEEDRGILASLISRALSTPTTRVSIGAVEGALSSDATIRDIQISDRDGVWLRLDRARIVWRRLALLQRRLEIDRLEVGTLDIQRRPVPAESQVPGEDQPLLPELPVKVEIMAFSLAELRLGEPILGTEARVAATGSARLSNDTSEGLELSFDARRLDRPGTLTARLGLVPQGQRLALTVRLEEPEGGLVARSLDISGLPPVKLGLNGQGTLDAFAADLAFDAGPGIGASGRAELSRDGSGRRLGLDLQATVEALLPELAAPVFAGTTRLTGAVRFGEEGTVSVEGVSLRAAAARLDVSGAVTSAGADLTVTAGTIPNVGARTRLAGAEIGRFAFTGRVTGPLTGPTVSAKLLAQAIATEAGRLANLDATFQASPAPAAAGGAAQVAITGDARATGLAPRDAALARATGDTLNLTLRGLLSSKGVAALETLTIASPNFTVRYAGRLGSDDLRGEVAFDAPNLRPFSDLLGLRLTGAASGRAKVEGTPRANRYGGAIEARVTELSSGLGPLDGLAGRQLSLSGSVRLEPTGEYRFEKLRLAGQNATAELTGSLGQDSGELKVTAQIPNLRLVDRRLTGRASLDGRVTGGLQRPNLAGEVALADASALGRPVPRLALTVDLQDVTGALAGAVRLDGVVDGKPARGGLRLARPASGAYQLDDLDLAIGSVAVRGGVTVDGSNLATGRLSLTAGNLADLSAVLLTEASGALTAEVVLATAQGGQNARVQATGENVRIGAAGLSRLEADLSVSDLYRRPTIAGRVAADEVRVAGETISRVRLTATGTPQASEVVLTAAARGFAIEAAANVRPGEPTRIELARLTATREGRRIALAAPATLTPQDGGLGLRGVNLVVGGGRVSLEGLVGSRLDLRVEARGVPLSAAQIMVPELDIAGTLDGSAQVSGAAAAPTGDYRARIDGLATARTRSLGLPRIDVAATGRLGGGRATLEATVTAGRAGAVRIGGSAPLGGSGALDFSVRGTLDAGAATATLLGAGGRRLTGRVELDGAVRGALAAPEVNGTATLAGGTFSDPTLGVRLSNIRARAVARGQELVIESASASTGDGGGSLTASGRVRLDAGAGYPGEIRIQGRNADLVRTRLVTAIVSLDLSVSGPLAQAPRIAGRVDVVGADVRVPEQLGATLQPFPKTRHLHPTRTTRARLALEARSKGRGGRAAPPFDAALDLAVTAPGRIIVRGRGLNAELGGSLRLTGTLANPVPNGAFELRRGTFQVVTSRLDFTRGRLTFTGDFTPELDFAAGTYAGGAAIQVTVTGPANNPDFSFTSNPDLPQDEVLSRLLFNSPSGQLSAFQALALAQAAAQFSGGEGSDSFEALRRSLGLSGLDIGLNAGGVGLGLQRALGDRVTVGVKAGATAAQTGIGVDVKITDEIRLQGEVTARGGTSVGIGGQFEW